jgi:hypothetical protein
MGTLIFVCPTTGHEVSTGVEIDRSNYKRLSRTRQRSFVRAAIRTICSLLSGLGWPMRPPKLRSLPLSLLFALKQQLHTARGRDRLKE